MQHFPLQPEQYQSFSRTAMVWLVTTHFLIISSLHPFSIYSVQEHHSSCFWYRAAKRWRDRWIWKRKLQQLSKICSYKVLCQIILQLARVAHGNEISLMGGLVGRRVLSHKQMLFNNYKCEPEQINLTHLNKQWEKQHARLLPLYDHMYRYV